MYHEARVAGDARGGRVRKWPPSGTVAGGLGGDARFTMVSRGVSPPSFTVGAEHRAARKSDAQGTAPLHRPRTDIRPPFGTLNANSATIQPLSNSDTDATNRHSTISQTIQQPLSNPAPTIGNLNPSTTVLQPPDGRFRAWQKPTTQPSFVSSPRTIPTQPSHIHDP